MNNQISTAQTKHKHTPGPWRVCEPYTNWAVFPIGYDRADGSTAIIAEVNSQGGTPDHQRANAELIAQAPALLAQRDALRDALQTILDGFEHGIFVRSIVGDGASDWAMKLIPFVNALGKAKAALAQKGPL